MRAAGPLLVATVVATLLAGCGATADRGIELGQLRDLARRVDTGGAECPLTLPASALRPSTVARNATILPFRSGTAASQGVVGDGLPTSDSVRITCRYAVDDLRVDLVVLGVPHGHALAGFADQLTARAGRATALTFIDANAGLGVGKARALPGNPPGAFARVAAAKGDVGLLVSAQARRPGARVPTPAAVAKMAQRIATALAD